MSDGRSRSDAAAEPPLRFRRRGGGGRHAAVAVEMGRADRRIGGRRRPDARGRQGALAPPLDGLAADYRYRIDELERDEPESARIARVRARPRNLVAPAAVRAADHRCARGVARARDVGRMDRAVQRAGARARCAGPTRVLRTLADLRPMADVGPVTLEEARDVLHDRLVTLDREPPARRYGRLFVGTPHQARGRAFRVVFVPGLAERVVPQRPREDPLLLDDGRARARCGAGRPGRARQRRAAAAEDCDRRRDASGCICRTRASTSAETRARVPSFYALDVMRAITGRVPDHRVLASEAAEEGGREPGVAGAEGSRPRHRRSRARPRGAQAAARLARSGGGQGPRALPARAERGAAPIGHQPLGARHAARGRRATA